MFKVKGILLKLLFIIFLINFTASAQKIDVTLENSYEVFVEELGNSKEIKYQEYLKAYDDYLKSHPLDVNVQVNRCRFIGNAFYDDYEDYDPNYDLTVACVDSLYNHFSDEPIVKLYKLEQVYGDERRELLSEFIIDYHDDVERWSYAQRTELFQNAAYFYTEENDRLAINYAKKAIRFSDSLDLSVLIADAYLRLGDEENAKVALLEDYYYTNQEAWQLNQKAELLIQFEEYDAAADLLKKAVAKDSSYVDNAALYEVVMQTGDYERARNYLVQDTTKVWKKNEAHRKLFEHDLEYGSIQDAFENYRLIQAENYYDDLLGFKRWRLFLKKPLEPFTFTEITHVLIFIFLLFSLGILPYLWVLPVDAYHKYFIDKSKTIKSILTVDWTLKHFWIISFLYLLAQVLLTLFFYYQDYLDYFFVADYYGSDELELDIDIANSLIIYILSMFIGTLCLVNKKRLVFIRRTKFSFLRMISIGILFVILNGILLRFLGKFIDFNESNEVFQMLSAREDIVAIFNSYGFVIAMVFVALLVPFYEEVMFRGIVLSAVEKKIGFFKANIFQAFLFAAVHFNLKLFIFYFIFGIVTGIAVKRTNGLLTGIFLHAINNFAVLLSIYYLSKILTRGLPF